MGIMAHRKTTKHLALWLTLAAMLFSALSPAMASVLFADRPDILARLLGAPAPSSAIIKADICHQHVADASTPSKAGPQSDEDADHSGHGIFCSFCIPAGGTVTLLPPVHMSAALVATAAGLLPAVRLPLPPAPPVSNHRSRAPPSPS